MKKKQEILKESYNNIMQTFGKALKGALDNFDTERGHVNEMARTATNRAVDPKALANVRDALQRRHYDKQWAIDAKPLPKLDDFQLLHRYVAALLLFNLPCPQTEEEIEEIGVFKNYAEKLLEGSGTIEDIQLLYSKNDKIVARERKGSKRAIKAYRDVQTPVAPIDNIDDDDELIPTPAPEPVAEPANDEIEYPSYEEAAGEDDINTDEYPSYDEVEGGEENPEANIEGSEEEEETPAAVSTEGPVEQQPIRKFNEWKDITLADYYDPTLNASFGDINDDLLKYDPETGLISMTMKIHDYDTKESREFEISEKSFGRLLEKYDIACESTVVNAIDKYYMIKTSVFCTRFWKEWCKCINKNPQCSKALTKKVQNFYYEEVMNTKTIDELAEIIKNMQFDDMPID